MNMRKIAILDWDGTLRRGFTIADWSKFLYDRGRLRSAVIDDLRAEFETYSRQNLSHDQLATSAAEKVADGLSGVRAAEVVAATKEFVINDLPSLFPFAIDGCKGLVELGYAVHVVSGAPYNVLSHYAFLKDLPVKLHCLEFEIENSVFTGGIASNPGISCTKMILMNKILEVFTEQTFVLAVGNSESDRPLFQQASVSIVVGKENLLKDRLALHISGQETWDQVIAGLGKLGVHL